MRTDEARGTCLIVGGGYVGCRLARVRVEKEPVRVLGRSPEQAVGVGLSVSRLDLDLPLPEGVRLADGATSVVYLVPPPGQGPGDERLVRFLEAMGQGRPDVFVYISTTGVYGDTGGRAVDEASPLAPKDEVAERRVAAEGLVQAWCRPRGVRRVVLRVPGIYGPHRLPLARLERGEPALRDEDAGPGNRIHVDDLVHVCEAVLDGRAEGVFNVGDGEHLGTGAFLARVAALAGLPAPRRVDRETAERELSPGMLAFLRSSRKVDTGRMEAELGVRLRYRDLDEGIRASLREMGHPVRG